MIDKLRRIPKTEKDCSFDMLVNKADRAVLRALAGQVAELSVRPIEDEKRALWLSHNALAATRPLIFCDPENGWHEIITQSMLECKGELARAWEMDLRKEIFWAVEMRDDRVIQPYINLQLPYTESDWGLPETKIGGDSGGAYAWEPPLKSYEDLDKLHVPDIRVDYSAHDLQMETADYVFGDLLAVRTKSSWWWSLGMTHTLIRLRGLEQIMLDMLDCPEGLHALMSILSRGHLAKLDFLESNGLLSLNNDGTYVGSGGFGWTEQLPQQDFSGTVRLRDMWGFCESQETVGVSPGMFEEFVFPYQLPILERFGLNCYGCCEPLDRRWSIVKRIPNLRRVSVSAWADVRKMADNLSDKYIFSWKPNPSDLACPSFDEEHIRRYVRDTLQATRDCRVEMIMKDCHTLNNRPERVLRWVQIVREEIEAKFQG